jgi:phosphotransacetylase
MSLFGFDALYALADRLPGPLPVVAAGGADGTVLAALSAAHRRGWVAPIVTGSEAAIRKLAAELELSLDGFRVIETEDPAAAAVAEVRAGRAACLMKGQIATPDLMKAVLDRRSGLRTDRVIAQVVLMEISRDARRFLLADTGITIQPTLEQKVDLLHHLTFAAKALHETSSVGGTLPLGVPPAAHAEPMGHEPRSRRDAGGWKPRIAVMSATEKVNAALPDTLEAAELQRRNENGEWPECVVQGPLSFDLAYASDAGEKKRIAGGVVGAADAMLFPNLLAANLTVKAMMYTADCRFGGVLCGAACPVVFMSRADSTSTRLNSLAFTLRLLTMRSAKQEEG